MPSLSCRSSPDTTLGSCDLSDLSIVKSHVDASDVTAAKLAADEASKDRKKVIVCIYRHDSEGTLWEFLPLERGNHIVVTEHFVQV